MRYRFGQFELDLERRQLLDADGAMPLRGHPFDILTVLVEAAPQVVSQSEIARRVWGHEALSESTLPQAIKELRTALGDSAKASAYVATEYGRGYRLVPEVHEVVEAMPERRRSKLPLMVGLATIVMALVLLLLPTESDIVAPAQAATWVLQPAQDDNSELSRSYAEYLAFVAGSTLEPGRVRLSRRDESPPDDRLIGVALAIVEKSGVVEYQSRLESPSESETRLFQEADGLMRSSVDSILETIVPGQEMQLESGLLSQSAYATETLLRGMAAQFAGELNRAIQLFEVCLEEDPDFDFARYELAIALRRQGDFSRALALLNVLELRHTSDFWVMRLANAKGIALWRLERFDEAARSLARSRQATHSPRGRSIVSTNLALLLRDQGQLVEARSASLDAVADARLAGDQPLEAGALNTLASILIRLGELDAALVELDRARELFYASGRRDSYARVLSRTAKLHFRRGEWEQAESMHRLAAGVRDQLGNALDLASSELSLSELARMRGDFSSAQGLAQTALDRGLELEHRGLTFDAWISLSETALAGRRLDDARNYLDQAARLAEAGASATDKQIVAERELAIGLATAARGVRNSSTPEEEPMLASQASALLAGALETGRTDDDLKAHLLAGRAAQHTGDLAAARGHFETVARHGAEQREVYVQILALLDLAELAAVDDSERALSLLRELEALDPPVYPYLRLKAQILAGAEQHAAALAAAFEAREKSGDWWQPADDALLAELESAAGTN